MYALPIYVAGLSSSDMMFLKWAAGLIILYSIVQLILEVIYFTQQLYLYFFDISTWVNVPLYIFGIIFVCVFTRECLCPFEWQWEVGIAAVFLVWAHFILYMRRMRVLGKREFHAWSLSYVATLPTLSGKLPIVLWWVVPGNIVPRNLAEFHLLKKFANS